MPVVSWTWQSKHPPQPAWQGEAKWDGWNKVFDMKPRQAFDRAFHVVVSGRRAYFGSSADDQVRCLDTDREPCFGVSSPRGRFGWRRLFTEAISISEVMTAASTAFGQRMDN